MSKKFVLFSTPTPPTSHYEWKRETLGLVKTDYQIYPEDTFRHFHLIHKSQRSWMKINCDGSWVKWWPENILLLVGSFSQQKIWVTGNYPGWMGKGTGSCHHSVCCILISLASRFCQNHFNIFPASIIKAINNQLVLKLCKLL